jgi:hypothetical protein
MVRLCEPNFHRNSTDAQKNRVLRVDRCSRQLRRSEFGSMLSTRKLQHAASPTRRGLKAETRAEDTNSDREQSLRCIRKNLIIAVVKDQDTRSRNLPVKGCFVSGLFLAAPSGHN